MAHEGILANTSTAMNESQKMAATTRSPDLQPPSESSLTGEMPSLPGSQRITDQEANDRGKITINRDLTQL